MRIIFMGASDLGWECCRVLFEIGQNLVGIFSIPREFRISWSPTPVTNVRYKSFQDLAEAHCVPLINVTAKLSDPSYKEIIRKLEPDIFIVIGWYYMIPRSIRELAPLGAVGVHASLLPKYRGGAPLVWAIINGETQSGVSLFCFDDGVDTGDVIGQKSFSIEFKETIAEVIQKTTQSSVQLVREFIPLVAGGHMPRMPQDHQSATLVPQRKPEDGWIDWRSKSSLQVYNWVRAQSRPYPGAWTSVGNEEVKVWSVILSDNSQKVGVPGSVTVDPQVGLGVRCADGRIVTVREIGLTDGTTMSGLEFAVIRHLSPGTVLGR